MRTAQINRKTKETDIKLTLSLDGGDVNVNTGIGFFDHMLTAFAVHGGVGVALFFLGGPAGDTVPPGAGAGVALRRAARPASGGLGGR